MLHLHIVARIYVCLCVYARAYACVSKHELPATTIAARRIVRSTTVNRGGVRVRAIVKVSNKFRRGLSSSGGGEERGGRESEREHRALSVAHEHRIDFPDARRLFLSRSKCTLQIPAPRLDPISR